MRVFVTNLLDWENWEDLSAWNETNRNLVQSPSKSYLKGPLLYKKISMGSSPRLISEINPVDLCTIPSGVSG